MDTDPCGTGPAYPTAEREPASGCTARAWVVEKSPWYGRTMRTISSTYLLENLARVLDELPGEPDGILITRYGHITARLTTEAPAGHPVRPEGRAGQVAATPQQAAGAVLRVLQESPGVAFPWRAVRPAYRLRRGVDTAAVLDVLRATPGVVVSPVPGREGWTLQYDDLL